MEVLSPFFFIVFFICSKSFSVFAFCRFWKVLLNTGGMHYCDEQRDGLKNYISEVVVQLSSNEASYRRERLYVNKLNVILVQVAALQFGNSMTCGM
ncbi:hypothetical protein Scep_024400 [Stephania cephalantha]|uniref:Uncharacterized protein n=1 Tax=Stephania cephalantha TaxID=152367 RepID=A0AAP0EZ87_9MAGN